jgi:predicted MFS family arabinose efflux permease
MSITLQRERAERASAPPVRELADQAFSRAAGAIRIGNAIGAAFTNKRVLEPVEACIMLTTGVLLLALATLFALFPRRVRIERLNRDV